MLEFNLVILAPPFESKSAGIVVLHRLYAELSGIKPNTRLALYRGIGNKFDVETVDGNYVQPEDLNDLFPESIFIVPEVLCGSRLKNLRVARYYLNRLGAIAPAIANVDTEFSIAWSSQFYSEAHFYLFFHVGKVPIPPDFESTQTNSRPINATYFGKKAGNYKETFPLPTSILITRSWPESTEHYLELLSMSNYLFTFDSSTSTNADAIMLGVKVVILDFSPDGEDAFKKLAPSQPYLTAENYDKEYAITNYIDKCNRWIRNLRADQSRFEANVRTLYETLQKFFGDIP